MLEVKNNYDVYTSTDEASSWLDMAHDALTPSEDAFIEKYLKNKSALVLDCGCGSGRIAFNVEKKGFKNVSGFDFASCMVEKARQSCSKSSSLRFFQEDATTMTSIDDSSYDYMLYLQQIISLISPEQVEQMLFHAKRIVKPGGIILFSALNIEGRKINLLLGNLVSFIRMFTKEPRTKQMLPWLKFGDKFNWLFWASNQPTNYWFYKKELENLLKKAGLDVLEITTSSELTNNALVSNDTIYAACMKRQ